MHWPAVRLVCLWVWFGALLLLATANGACAEPGSAGTLLRNLKLHVSWGHTSRVRKPFFVKVVGQDLKVGSVVAIGFEKEDSLTGTECHSEAGADDADGLEVTLSFSGREIAPVGNVQQIWQYLLDHSDADTVRRLKNDPAYRPDSRKLTLDLNREGTSGVSLTVDQLLREGSFWFPELDLFVTTGEREDSFTEHRQVLTAWARQRISDRIRAEPEATYGQFTNRWEDMGSPAYNNPHSVWPGHIVGLTWDSAIAKFGVDRGGNVRNDYGNPDQFYLGFDFGALDEELKKNWKGQSLADGLPVLTTEIRKNGIEYRLEHWAYPLEGPPTERRGDLEMVLFGRLVVRNPSEHARRVSLKLDHRRRTPSAAISVEQRGSDWIWRDASTDKAWLVLLASDALFETNRFARGEWVTNLATLSVTLPPAGSRELLLKLPSAPLPMQELGRLLALEVGVARAETIRFWQKCLDEGAQFSVPEPAVNALFHANLWHALRLPRRHGLGLEAQLDLPYSNFAYDQKGTPWPVNQAVYVDYMLYDLRGYHKIAAEELAAMYRNNQETNGHVGGFANWGVYTPGMIYAVANHFLLAGDREEFEALLPQTLKALDWCLAQVRAAQQSSLPAGLVQWPLNDLSHDPRPWAFNQAYVYAGLERMGLALKRFGHPRGEECELAARALQRSIASAFGRASMLCPAVQLMDHTWIPYVPSEASAQGRLMQIWYPTDVDTGALHLSRLGALPADNALTRYLLLDHEDNLFLNHWGMANEPVYNQQAAAYLADDDPKAAIRAFYSMMACAFSHSVFEPVEHRWGWGQYFGPPSTDGAWVELYRRMLVDEGEDNTLRLGQAAPRRWFLRGEGIRVERAPTWFGPITFRLESEARANVLRAAIEMPRRNKCAALLVRFRHPEGKWMRRVTVNGRKWLDFDAYAEWVRIPTPEEKHYRIVVRYD